MPVTGKSRFINFIVTVALLIVLATIFFLYNNRHPNQSKLPHLTLHALTGRLINISALRGKPVVLNLWATWCPPCKAELPLLMHYQHKYPSIVFLYAEQGNSHQTVQKFANRHHLPSRNVLIDTSTKLSSKFGVLGYPTTVFFNSSGQILSIHRGQLNPRTLKAMIKKIRIDHPT